ncbi:MAG: tRNA preQ1(34) S-adenosylmethionine ribosyltransferase-isomerase QueA [Deltaproteobacteria bacterium]|nr:tRNA preQ1(34) S-adenosylmethionine ribosyltransferase-isomerase QueA [Deltaproteobacteria bacterium]
MDDLLTLSHFDFILPPGLIAQAPCAERDQSRLMVLDRETGNLEHRHFTGIIDYLISGDVLVVNDTQVIPARLEGKKKSGGRVECLILHYTGHPVYETYTTPCLLKAGGKIRAGDRIYFGESLTGEILSPSQNGTVLVRFYFEGGLDSALKKFGQVPLPPYIHRDAHDPDLSEQDRVRYQTVYARNPGAVAAPTAGLHFSPGLIASLKAKGVGWVSLTLPVGYGTFAPVKTEKISEHKIHSESFSVPAQTARVIREHKERGGRIIAVGTTCVRALEYLALKYGTVKAEEGDCDLFITPGFSFQVIDGLITNFHLPRTTLLMLVSAFAGMEKIQKAYREAIERKYRFYSYGDAMLIL